MSEVDEGDVDVSVKLMELWQCRKITIATIEEINARIRARQVNMLVGCMLLTCRACSR